MSIVSSRDLTRPGSRSSTYDHRPILLLERCLAIQFEATLPKKTHSTTKKDSRPGSSLSQISNWFPWQRSGGSGRKTSVSPKSDDVQDRESTVSQSTSTPVQSPPGWVYDGGFVMFQNFQEANGYCYWNTSLLDAIRTLQFIGHFTPSTILVTGDESCLEIIRAAWARKVLRAPRNYSIALIGDVDGCAVQPINQGQFTPLPEALCWVIWELNLAERSTSLTDVSQALGETFPDLVPPTEQVIYDTLGRLIRDRKIFYTGKGYGVVTPDTFRKTSVVENKEKSLLLSNEEALTLAHGTVESYPSGNVVHKAIQTNLVDVICRGNGTDKILYGRTVEEVATATRTRLQRQRSLRLFHGSSNKRLSWSEYKGGSGGSLRLSPSKAKKLLDEYNYTTDWEDYAEDIEVSAKVPKEKLSLLSRLFRRSPQKKRTTLVSFSAQFPPPEWTDNHILHLHSIGVQTHFSESPTSVNDIQKCGVVSSAQSECSSSLSFSSPSPSQRSFHRRRTLAHPPSVRSDSCSPFRVPLTSKHATDDPHTICGSRSPATSISSGLGRSFSPASAHSYQRPLGTQSPPSPTQSTDSLYSSSLGPSASVVQSPVPSFSSKSVLSDRTFHRNNPARASYAGRYTATPTLSLCSRPLSEYESFSRSTPRTLSYRAPRSLNGQPNTSAQQQARTADISTSEGPASKLIAQQKAAVRENFFRSALSSPTQVLSALSDKKLDLPRLEKPLFSPLTSNKKYYETDLDFTIKVPKKSGNFHQEKNLSSPENPASRVINISVTKSESLNFVTLQNEANSITSELNKENADDLKIADEKPNLKGKSTEDTFRTFPSLTELNINFKSITGQKILQGLNSNSTDTLVEVNMREGEVKTEMTYV